MRFIFKFLDFLFLRPFFARYFRSRMEALMINNFAREGITVVEYINVKFKNIYGFVFKYPDVKKVLVKKEIYDSIWPQMMQKIKMISKEQIKLRGKKNER